MYLSVHPLYAADVLHISCMFRGPVVQGAGPQEPAAMVQRLGADGADGADGWRKQETT